MGLSGVVKGTYQRWMRGHIDFVSSPITKGAGIKYIGFVSPYLQMGRGIYFTTDFPSEEDSDKTLYINSTLTKGTMIEYIDFVSPHLQSGTQEWILHQLSCK